MELNRNNRVLFDPVSHSYLLDGERLLMGVTHLMEKHHLSANYSGISDDVLKRAADEGTAIHKELQAYDDGDAVFASPLIDNYKRLLRNNYLKPVASEYPVSDYELVASAIDKVYETKGGVILGDIKATQKYHRRALEWQLGIYKVFFERQNPEIPVVGCICIWIDKKTRRINGIIPVEPVTEGEVNALLDCERRGETYVDTAAIKDASLVIPEEELAGYVANAKTIAELKEQIKFIEEKMGEYNAKLVSYMEENNLEAMAVPHGEIRLKKSYTQTRVDSAALKSNYPSVWAKVSKETLVKGSISFKPKE